MSIPIIFYPKIDSTNEEAKRVLVSSDRIAPFAIVAAEQTAGRGTADRKWESNPGDNITISYCFSHQEIEIGKIPLSLVVAFTLTDLLYLFGIRANIKYPNDVYVNGRKIGGILIETGFWGQDERHVVIGIGLNVHQKNFAFSMNSATSMNIITNQYYNLDDIVAVLSEKLEKYLVLQPRCDIDEINDLFLWRNEKVECLDIWGNQVVRGVFKGLAHADTICLETNNGLQLIPVSGIKTMNYVG